jgi:hypothetical protein
MAPRPLPPEQIGTPTGIGINEGNGGACADCERGNGYPCLRHHPDATVGRERVCHRGRRVLRRFVSRGGELVEVESVVRETR